MMNLVVPSLVVPFAERENQTQARLDERFIRAAERGCVKSLKAALAVGADLFSMDETRTQAVHTCASKGRIEALQFLLDTGADLFARDFMQWTPLHEAAAKGQAEAADFLINVAGCPVNVREGTSATPLHAASSLGQLAMCQFLVSQGADMEAVDACGYTPLNQAATEGNTEVCQYLLSAGADIDTQNKKGRTPISSAAGAGHLETVKVLAGFPSSLATEIKKEIVQVIHLDMRIMSRDASNIVTDFAVPLCDLTRDSKGHTALDIALERKHSQIVEFLQPLQLPEAKESERPELKRSLS